MPTPMKRCPRCGVETDRATEFGDRAGWCRKCVAEYAREKYRNDPAYRDRAKAYHRANEKKKRADPQKNAIKLENLRNRYRNDPEWREWKRVQARESRLGRLGRHLAQEAKKRSKKKGLVFTITYEWTQALWETDKRCAYCRVETRSAQGAIANDSATLDRVNTSQGYTPENTVIACFRCNTLKRDATLAEMETLVANWRRVITPN